MMEPSSIHTKITKNETEQDKSFDNHNATLWKSKITIAYGIIVKIFEFMFWNQKFVTSKTHSLESLPLSPGVTGIVRRRFLSKTRLTLSWSVS